MMFFNKKRPLSFTHSAVAAIVFAASATLAHAGSFDDFFTRIIRDDAPGISALVKRGFDPNTVNDKGETGLTQAFKLDSFRAAKGLIDTPSTNVNLANSRGETPLMMAANKGQLDLAKALIKRGADVNREGWTPLHYAVSTPSEDGSDLKIIALLLEHHAYIDAASPNGSTPLMLAAQYGTRSAVQLLIKEGADPSVKNQQGLQAKDFAERAERDEVVQWLAATPNAVASTAKGQGSASKGTVAAKPAGTKAAPPNGPTVPPAFPQEGRRKIQSNW